MALAGDHAHQKTESWREILGQLYSYGLAVSAVALLWFFPPRLDFHPAVIIPVLVVALFLVLMERPMRTAATTVAPLTAIMSASAVVFGAWMLVLAGVAALAIRWRLSRSEGLKGIYGHGTVGQIGSVIVSAYAVLGSWSWLGLIGHQSPAWLAPLLTLISIVALGLIWQTASNLLAYVHYRLLGSRVSISQLLRTGIVASIYGYLLVGMYKFGGILATAIFYTVVAQIKVLQDVLGITTQLHKLERAQDQAQGMVRDLVKLTDSDNTEFGLEVQNIAQMMGRHIGMSRRDIELLGLAAELHQIGKARLPARIRFTATSNQKEDAQRKTYTRWGGLMIRAADAVMPPQIADWIEFHGEHYDGSGYPRGLKGDDIPMPSRVIAIARDYVRLLTGYDGADAVDKEKALTLLRDGSGTLYDPRLVKLLYDLVS